MKTSVAISSTPRKDEYRCGNVDGCPWAPVGGCQHFFTESGVMKSTTCVAPLIKINKKWVPARIQRP